MIDDVNDFGKPPINCTATDTKIAQVILTQINGANYDPAVDPPFVCQGATVTIGVRALLQTSSQKDRADVGVWVATDGGDAQTGQCNHYIIPPGQNIPNAVNGDGDSCAGIAEKSTVSLNLGAMTVPCVDNNNDGFLDLNGCVAWDVPGQDGVCPDNRDGVLPAGTTNDYKAATIPGTPAKCNCSTFQIPVIIPGHLTLIKRIINDNGGTKTVGDFNVHTSGGALTFGAGVADGANTLKYTSNQLGVTPGSYTLREDNVAGYTEGTWSCTGATPSNTSIDQGAVTVPNATSVVCTITNDDQPGSLQLVKRIVNDNGGTKTVADFNVHTDAGAITFGAGAADGANTLKYTGTKLTVAAGSYTLREDDVAGYGEGTWSCTGATPSNTSIDQGAVTVPNGVDVVCTITNDDASGSLQLVKRIVNNSGGTKTVADFNVHTDAGAITFGAGAADGANTLKYTGTKLTVNAGSYTLREDNVANYTEGTWSCTGATPSNTSIDQGAVTVPNGVDVVCTITNDDDVVGRGQIAPTATTCEAFAAGESATLAEILATKNKGKIQSLAPGVFFYYADIVKGAGAISVTQTVGPNPAGLVQYQVQQGQAFLYTVSGGVCTKVATLTEVSGVWTGGGGLPAGTYVLGVKYATDANVGANIGPFSANDLLATHNFNVGGASAASVNTKVKP